MTTSVMDDPVIRWMYPEPGRYLEWLPRLVEVIGAPAFERSTADLHCEGVAATRATR